FARSDRVVARPALVVESNDARGRAAHVRHNEADAGIKFSGMPLDLGDNPPRLGPGSAWKASFHTPATRSALSCSSRSRIGNMRKAKVRPRHAGLFVYHTPSRAPKSTSTTLGRA